jgi:hypothetical protein
MAPGDGGGAVGCGSSKVLLIASDQFEIIFQILKEVPNLPDQLLARLRKMVGDVTLAVQSAREIDGIIEGAATVKLVIGHPESAAEANRPPFSSVAGPSVAYGEIEAFVSRGLLQVWTVLVEAVLESFSERELSLRTGYSRGDLERACGLLLG